MGSPRAIGKMRQVPRAWARLVDAQAALMPDAAWIVHQGQDSSGGAVNGAPVFDQIVFGGPSGFAAKLSTPTQAETQDPDKWHVETTHTIAVMCDVEPVMADFVDVLAPVMLNSGLPVRFRITGDLQARRAFHGRVLMWHAQLQRLTEQ